MYSKRRLALALTVVLTVFIFVELHLSTLKQRLSLETPFHNQGFGKLAQDFLIPKNGDGGRLTQRPDNVHATAVQSCQEIPNRWSLMYDPSRFRGRSKFPLVDPHIEPKLACEEKILDIIVTVNSGTDSPKHRALRQAIRQTWANTRSLPNHPNSGRWRLFFALGLTKQVTENNLNIQEAEKNNDVIIGNFSDVYRNIPIKTFMSHLWAFSKFSFKYILKTDDDVYVRVPVLHQWLVSQGTPKRFYGGYMNRNPIVFRNPGSKWHITHEEFKENRWPDFCHGAFQILSIDLLPPYLYYTQVHKPFHTDDAYMGVMARDFGVPVKDIPGFSTQGIPKANCDLWKAISIGHDIDPKSMVKIHETYKELYVKNKSPC